MQQSEALILTWNASIAIQSRVKMKYNSKIKTISVRHKPNNTIMRTKPTQSRVAGVETSIILNVQQKAKDIRDELHQSNLRNDSHYAHSEIQKLWCGLGHNRKR